MKDERVNLKFEILNFKSLSRFHPSSLLFILGDYNLQSLVKRRRSRNLFFDSILNQ
jgi:hypothetical protein